MEWGGLRPQSMSIPSAARYSTACGSIVTSPLEIHCRRRASVCACSVEGAFQALFAFSCAHGRLELLLRRGGRHDVWTDGEREEAVPRHRNINEQLARAILRWIRKEN